MTNEIFANDIRKEAHITFRGMPGLGDAMGMSESTIRKRVKNPCTFSIDELRNLCEVLNLDRDRTMAFIEVAIFGRNHTTNLF